MYIYIYIYIFKDTLLDIWIAWIAPPFPRKIFSKRLSPANLARDRIANSLRVFLITIQAHGSGSKRRKKKMPLLLSLSSLIVVPCPDRGVPPPRGGTDG